MSIVPTIIKFGLRVTSKVKTCASLISPSKVETLGLKMKSPVLSDCVHISEQNKHWKSLVDDLNSYIKPENFLGSGREAEVYKVNGNYILRIEKIKEKLKMPQDFKPHKDFFEGKNYGQAVAVSKDGTVSINKFVKGKPLYGSNWNINKSITKEQYMKTFNEIKTLPDETFVDYIKDIINIRKKGYNIDSVNPNNFLLDKKKINIIDIAPDKVKPKIMLEDFDSLINKNQLYSLLKSMSKSEIKIFADEIKAFYDRMLKIARKEGYNFQIPSLNNRELQDITTYLYHKNWNMINLMLY